MEPPAFGIMHPNSVYEIAPKIEKIPQAIHIIKALPTDPVS